MMWRRALVLFLLAPAAASAHPGHGPVVVQVIDFDNRYDPQSVTVGVGDPVIWNWGGSVRNHSVTADDGSFDSDPGKSGLEIQHEANDQYIRPFDTVGTFSYHCKVHGDRMYGQVRVVPVTGRDVIPPNLSGLRVSRSSGRYRVHFTVSERSDVLARIRRAGKTIRVFDLSAQPGANRKRIPTASLEPGRYGLTLQAYDTSDNGSNTVKTRFRVRRR